MQILILLHSQHEKKSFSEKCVCVCAVSYTHLILIVLHSKHEKSRFPKCVCVCVCLSVCLSVDFLSMANDNCRKFKQNQIIFCIHPCIVDVSINFDFFEDRLRGRGSLPATFFYQAYFLWQTITAANTNRIK